MKKTTYKQPTLKVVAFKSEQGFALSGGPLFDIDGYYTVFDHEDEFELILEDNNTPIEEITFWQ